MKYPYQVVAFFDHEPQKGESIYQGDNGWYPQVALKRRFDLSNITEQDLLDKLQEFANVTDRFTIEFLEATRPERMPVEVIPTTGVEERIFHRNLIAFLGSRIVSKYPEREDTNYYPHMTIEWNRERVVRPSDFENTQRTVEKYWLVKDPKEGEDSIAYEMFELRNPM